MPDTLAQQQQGTARGAAATGPATTAPASPLRGSGEDATRTEKPKVEIEDLDFWYDGGATHALKSITMQLYANEVTAFIGPSGCGKSTLLRCLNRMNELTPGTRLEGRVAVDGQDLYAGETDPVVVRRRIGMVFQKPNPFPKSIRKNVLWGAKINGLEEEADELVERALRQAALWDEVKDRLDASAYGLSGGQQQRLCIARALAVRPDVLLMDEPTSALDPTAAAKVEETIADLKKRYTTVIVTHNMQQAERVSDRTAFMYLGELVEMNRTETLFKQPERDRTADYIAGVFG